MNTVNQKLKGREVSQQSTTSIVLIRVLILPHNRVGMLTSHQKWLEEGRVWVWVGEQKGKWMAVSKTWGWRFGVFTTLGGKDELICSLLCRRNGLQWHTAEQGRVTSTASSPKKRNLAKIHGNIYRVQGWPKQQVQTVKTGRGAETS